MSELDREVRVRKDVLRVFNLRRENFATLREYNDYLEKVEDIIFDLAYSNDNEVKLKRQREIDEFKQVNKNLIAKNRALQENEYKQKKLEEERKLMEAEERKEKEAVHKHLQEITMQEKQEEKAASTSFMGIFPSQLQKRQPAPKMIIQTAEPYSKLSKEDQRRFERAAGYSASFVLERANQEAYRLVL
ncbi:hypothetical protein C9374_004967 [Naegleria lovaniensis]|uniref:MAT1 centre domain-containing protein n=1 Tax=Naegleria lovaniensis TaxID=51637 RepID=A0AA88KKX2_NAELO|nr:uncharacterized protein C9374_004967 [Naegleria lovaniensis]KAG2383000.1 hypothetical protein C9374_004967 [Naegleria lovaniensis]